MKIINLWLKQSFSFLNSIYSFKICDKQEQGAYYYYVWTNNIIKIKVLFDEREDNPISIFVYDARTLGTIYDIQEYKAVLFFDGTRKEKIKYAAAWLKNEIVSKRINISRNNDCI